ncbi:LOW QUALITY PROTEIN: hypothetical protein CVT26_013524 [Gymnopilus dilepis]|uniref:Uncharacterized protein n=1 Tax=Gymnopilus dilepis TaxID=231916 RepID=A0A409Y5K4_9AGAR|nr:LOW QUALITY PROTEIN: hypothetical protein CVT26_013524 [Gymnopilus dilepis]
MPTLTNFLRWLREEHLNFAATVVIRIQDFPSNSLSTSKGYLFKNVLSIQPQQYIFIPLIPASLYARADVELVSGVKTIEGERGTAIVHQRCLDAQEPQGHGPCFGGMTYEIRPKLTLE